MAARSEDNEKKKCLDLIRSYGKSKEVKKCDYFPEGHILLNDVMQYSQIWTKLIAGNGTNERQSTRVRWIAMRVRIWLTWEWLPIVDIFDNVDQGLRMAIVWDNAGQDLEAPPTFNDIFKDYGATPTEGERTDWQSDLDWNNKDRYEVLWEDSEFLPVVSVEQDYVIEGEDLHFYPYPIVSTAPKRYWDFWLDLTSYKSLFQDGEEDFYSPAGGVGYFMIKTAYNNDQWKINFRIRAYFIDG